jgi:X-Pro dipeptidyl-peptidase
MKALWALCLAALVAAGLAGCVGVQKDGTPAASGPDLSVLSPAHYKIKPPEEVWVPSASDGKRLNNAVYRPDTTEKVPVYINFSPYWGDTAMKEGDAFAQYMIHEYVPRGYAVVLSAVRGTGHSEGCFQIGGDLELKDAYDVVDHFSKQPWGNGNIGAGAKSYDSTTQNGMVAKFPHPALKTIFHVSGITDMYRYNGKDGVTYANGLTFTPEYYATQGLDEYAGATNGAGGPGDESPQSLLRAADDAACTEAPKHASSGTGAAADGLKDAYWQERDWVRFLPRSTWTGSVFFVHGLQDWNVKPDNIDPWLQELHAKGNFVKGWLHQWSQGGTGHVYPMRTDWNVTMLRWLDHYLKGIDTGIERDPAFDIEGSDTLWRHADSWPPAGGAATASNPLGPGDLPTLEAVKAVAGKTRISGTPWVKVTATSLSPDPVLYAGLYDVAPGGQRTEVNEAARRGLLSDDLAGPNVWAPGTAQAFNLTFYPMDLELAAGHSLAVQFGVAPTDAMGPTGNAGFVITPSQAHVTYASATFGFTLVPPTPVMDPQPKPMTCFTC